MNENQSAQAKAIVIYVDADACPVKQEIYRVAERAAGGDVVISADIPLAARCVKSGADVIAPNGKVFSEASIGMALATRNLMDSLRSAGEVTGGPKPFAPRDRSEFLSALDRAIVRLKTGGLFRRPLNNREVIEPG